VGDRIAHEGQTAQDDEHANHAANEPDQHDCQKRVTHEGVLEWFEHGRNE
jgi:hypothetical protein